MTGVTIEAQLQLDCVIKVRAFRTKGESTRLWASSTCPIYVEFSFFSIALAAEISTSEPFWIPRFRTTLIRTPCAFASPLGLARAPMSMPRFLPNCQTPVAWNVNPSQSFSRPKSISIVPRMRPQPACVCRRPPTGFACRVPQCKKSRRPCLWPPVPLAFLPNRRTDRT